MATLDEYVAAITEQHDVVNRQFAVPEDVITYVQLYNEQIVPKHTLTKIDIRGLGSSFIIGDFQYGKLGSDLSPQPWLGNAGGGLWVTSIEQTPNNPFVNAGKIQIRDFLIGSTAAVPPSRLLVGSGTLDWNVTQSGLQYQTGSFSIGIGGGSSAGIGFQGGSWLTTISSANFGGSVCLKEAGWYEGSSHTFSTTSDYISIDQGLTTAFAETDMFCVECWFNPSGLNVGQQNLIDWGYKNFPADSHKFAWRLFLENGSLSMMTSSFTVGNYFGKASTASIGAGSWHHAAGVYSGNSTGNGSIFVYLNGTKGGVDGAYVHDASIADGSGHIQIGTARSNAGFFENIVGSIDEVRISKGTMRYTTNFTPGSVIFSDDANTVFLYHLDEFVGAGSTAVDFSSNGYNAIVSGAVTTKDGYVGSMEIAVWQKTNISEFSEIGLASDKLYIRDTFPTVSVGSSGSEIRFMIGFIVGSA